jgi:hypothetical protein
MKKLFLTAVGIALLAVQASATLVYVDQVAGYHASDGEFNVSPVIGAGYDSKVTYNNNLGALGFGTFCIDRNTSITVPGTYNATVYENGLNPASGLLIAQGTGWLYGQFARGTLAGYNYNGGLGGQVRADSAYYLQLAIWVLEQQYWYGANTADLAADLASGNPFITAVANQYGGGVGGLTAAMLRLGGNASGVGVLGLQDLRTDAQRQPMLTLLPDGGSALILLGMALSSIALIARKIRE